MKGWAIIVTRTDEHPMYLTTRSGDVVRYPSKQRAEGMGRLLKHGEGVQEVRVVRHPGYPRPAA